MITEHSSVVAADNLISSHLKKDLVLLDLNSGTYYGLNHVGARVWKLIQQPTRVAEIERTLLEEYEVQPEVFRRDLLALLGALHAHNLVHIDDASAAEAHPSLSSRTAHSA